MCLQDGHILQPSVAVLQQQARSLATCTSAEPFVCIACIVWCWLCRTVTAAGAAAETGAEAAAEAPSRVASKAVIQQPPLGPHGRHPVVMPTVGLTAGSRSSSCSGQQIPTGVVTGAGSVIEAGMKGVGSTAEVGMVTGTVSRITG